MCYLIHLVSDIKMMFSVTFLTNILLLPAKIPKESQKHNPRKFLFSLFPLRRLQAVESSQKLTLLAAPNKSSLETDSPWNSFADINRKEKR